MKQRIICKALAVAVILLFLGVGIQPSLAVQPNNSDNEEECDICPSVKDLFDSEDIEKYQDLLDKIKSIKERNNRINSDRPSICDILDRIDDRFSNYETSYVEILEELYEDERYFLFSIVIIPFLLSCIVMSPFYFVYISLCIPPP